MRLQLLHTPDCPNVAPLAERLTVVLADLPDVQVDRTEVTNARQATALGMTGSPTLLVDGLDPFAIPGLPPSISCRLYRNGDGQVRAVPSLAQLRAALTPRDGDHD